MRLLLAALLCALTVPAWAQPVGDLNRWPVRLGEGRYGFIDRSGEVVIPADTADAYRGVLPFSEGLGAVRVGRGWGFVDTTGALVIPPRFQQVYAFDGGVARVLIDGAWAVIDDEGRLLTEPRYSQLLAPGGGRMPFRTTTVYTGLFGIIRIPRADVWGLLDVSGARAATVAPGLPVVAEPQYQGMQSPSDERVPTLFARRRLFISLPDKWGYLDRTGETAIAPRFELARPFSEGLAFVYEDERYGYIDEDGAFALIVPYLEGGPFVGGRARVRDGQRWGFLDREGELAIPLVYRAATDFSEGLAAVQQDGRWGYVDDGGATVLPFRYLRARPFRGGLARVVLEDGRDAYVDRAGETVWAGPEDAP